MVASTAHLHLSVAPIPRGEKRRREIAAVAERVFFETGFAETTMQAIAARAGASKETLYRHFGSKEELFAEIVSERAKCWLEDLDEKFAIPGSVAEVLRTIGTKMLESILEEDAVLLCRTVMAESVRNPELGVMFMAAGPDRVRKRLAEFLAAATARGELQCAEATVAARIFIGAVVSSYHLGRLVLAEPPRMSRAEMRAHVDEVVAMVMARYARPAPAKLTSA